MMAQLRETLNEGNFNLVRDRRVPIPAAGGGSLGVVSAGLQPMEIHRCLAPRNISPQGGGIARIFRISAELRSHT